MGMDLWFRDDVARILTSTHETMRRAFETVPPQDPEAAETYGQGFADALQAVALAFGLVSSGPGGAAARDWPQQGVRQFGNSAGVARSETGHSREPFTLRQGSGPGRKELEMT